MTSRERVYKAIRFEEPDRVPVDIGGTIVTGIHMDAYVQIAKNLGLDLEPPKVIEQFLMVAKTDLLMMKWLGSDVINLENIVQNWDYANENWQVWRTNKGNSVLMPGEFMPYKDKNGYIYINGKDGNPCAYMSPNGDYFDRAVKTSLSDEIVYANPKEWKASLPNYKEEHLRLLEKRAKFYHEYTDYSIHGGFTTRALFTPFGLAGHTFSDWLCLMATEPEYTASIVMAMAEWELENLIMYLQAVGPYIDTILMSTSDFGSQKSTLFNPEQYKTIYLPAFKMLNDYVHSHGNTKTMYHSCGSVRNLMNYFIDAGVDILNPIQTAAGGMDPWELKKEFGKKIVFWGGGADTQHTLPSGTPEEVRQQVKERISAFAPGGGFIFSQIHNLQSDIPFENVKAMVEAVREFGSYPIKIE
ncbi:MAG: uroporphyrinogen decarboxylase family protein [Christensenellales bacterium]